MAAADAMIHSTAGLTVLEAHIRGCPVVSYGFSAGHLRANNAAFERFGLAEVARSDHELESVLRHVTHERRSPDSSFASLPSIASRVLTVRPQGAPAAGLAPARRARRDRRRVPPSRRPAGRWCCPSLIARAPREGRETDREPDPHRQGRRRVRRSVAPARPCRRVTAPRRHGGQRQQPLIARPARGGRGARRRFCTPGPAWLRWSRRSAMALGVAAAPGGRRRGGDHLRRRAAPAGHPADPGDPARGRRHGDLLPRRRAGRRGARRWPPRSSPPGTGSSSTATGTATSCG